MRDCFDIIKLLRTEMKLTTPEEICAREDLRSDLDLSCVKQSEMNPESNSFGAISLGKDAARGLG